MEFFIRYGKTVFLCPRRIYLLLLHTVVCDIHEGFYVQTNIYTKPKIFVFLIDMKDLCFEVI